MGQLETTDILNAPTEVSAPAVGSRLRSIVIGSIGNLVEWYDWYIYSALTVYFAKTFFPYGNQTEQWLQAAGVFALGFLMRPIGGWVLGAYADRYGRRAALSLSVLLMSFGSLLIAATPGYDTIGMAAPILLLAARLLQGLSVGGEYGTSATYLSEMADESNRGFYSSFQYVTLVAGQLGALGVLMILQHVLLTKAELAAWGWRIPFVIGALFAVFALYLRSNIGETEAFARQGAGHRSRSLLADLARHPRAILTVIGLTMGGTVAFYTFTIYTQKFLIGTVGMTKEDSALVLAAALLVFALIQPVVGALSDRIGRRPVLIAFGTLGTLLTVPILTALSHAQDVWTAFGLILAALVIVSGYTSINAVVKAELFPVEIRALGVGLPYALTVSIFGGTAEYVALWCKDHGVDADFYWYVTACIGLSLLVYVFMPDTKKVSTFDRQP